MKINEKLKDENPNNFIEILYNSIFKNNTTDNPKNIIFSNEHKPKKLKNSINEKLIQKYKKIELKRKCKEIKGINKFNTKNVTNMRVMFQACNELLYLDLSNFNTDNVTDMEFMFNECHKLEYLNILNFKLKNNCNNNNMLIDLNKNCNIIHKFK